MEGYAFPSVLYLESSAGSGFDLADVGRASRKPTSGPYDCAPLPSELLIKQSSE
jgi:hypothetical protein